MTEGTTVFETWGRVSGLGIGVAMYREETVMDREGTTIRREGVAMLESWNEVPVRTRGGVTETKGVKGKLGTQQATGERGIATWVVMSREAHLGLLDLSRTLLQSES